MTNQKCHRELPPDLVFFTAFPYTSLKSDDCYYIVQFERRRPDQDDQYYVAILDINAPVISSDPRAVCDLALVWEHAPNTPTLAQKISAWLGEQL